MRYFGNILSDTTYRNKIPFPEVSFQFCIFVSFLIFTLGMVIFFLGIYSFMKQKRQKTSRYYLIISIFFGLWEVGIAFINISVSCQNQIAMAMVIVSSVVILPVSIVYIFQRAEFTETVINGFVIFLVYMTTIFLGFIIEFYHPKYILKPWGTSVIFEGENRIQIAILLAYEVVCGLIFICGCSSWASKTHLKRVKSQIKFFIAYVLTFLLANCVTIIAPCMMGTSSNPFGSILMFAAFMILMCSLYRAKAFDVSIEMISDDIINYVKMPVIAIDGNDTILLANKAAEELFGIKVDESKGLDWAVLFEEDFTAENRGINRNVIIKRGHIPVKLTTTVIRDEYGDIIYSLTYITDMTREQTLMNELEESKREAESANKAKGDFLANMSHEIRTPINAVLGLDEMIIRESKERDIHNYAIDIKGAAKTLLGLVNEVLDFSKIESGKLEIIMVQYDLASVINDVYNMLSAKAEEKGLQLNLIIDEHIPHFLYGDEIRIKQIILNIANNGIKYTTEGYVEIAFGSRMIDEEHIGLDVTIKDTGIGMKSEDIEKLTSPFVRIEEKRNRSIEGTGLGMSITSSLLKLMDSDLNVQSEYGKGTTFSFEVNQKVMEWEPIGDIAKRHAEIQKLEGMYKESYCAPDAHILVVDDNLVNLTVIRGLLKRTLIQVDTADSGKECLEMIQHQKYHVILLDHMMPEMDGIEVCHRIHEDTTNQNHDIPIIALTANAVSGAREMYLKEGFMDYISKPVDAIVLEERIHRYIPKELLMQPEEVPEEQREAMGIQLQTEPDLSQHNESSDQKQEKQPVESNDTLLDVQQGIATCGGLEEIYWDAVKEFAITIPTRANRIEELFQAEDIRNYTIEVHGLKSSARLIGALGLSHMAEHLEMCGKENKITEIREKTQELLALYRSYMELLKPYVNTKQEEEKEQIDEAFLEEARAALLEFIEAYDFDNADAVMKQLEEWRMPEHFQKTYEKLVVMMAEVDRDGILELLR